MKYIYPSSISLIVFLFVAFTFCTVDKTSKIIENEFTRFNINIDQISDSCDNFIQYAEFIPLEFNNQAILNSIDKLILNTENLIVFDKRQKQVVVFDKLGNFYSKIRRYGKGPDEYLFPSDIIYDENKIGILAQSKGFIIWFNLNGDILSDNYISRKKLILSQASISGNQIYHFNHNSKSGKNPYQLNITDKGLKNINFSMFKSNPEQISCLHMHPFNIYNDNITLHLPYDRYIYKITQGEASKLFYFDFEDRNLPKNLLEKILSVKDNMTSEQIQRYNKEILNFVIVKEAIPLKDFIYIEIAYKYQRFCALINIHDGSSHIFRNNLGESSFGKYIGCIAKENTIYFEIPPTQIKKYRSSKVINPEVIEEKYNQNLLKNNPWILKIQLQNAKI